MEWSLLYEAIKQGGEIALDENKRSEFEKKIRLLIRKNRRIVVFGNSGSGKSQMVNSLKNILSVPKRNLTPNKTRVNIQDFPLKLIDTPGHPDSGLFRQKEIETIIKNGVEGIINVLSFGYDETPDADKGVAFDDKGHIKPSFLEKNRIMEIERLNEWLKWIRPTNTKWVINLVNKADIWWEQYSDVDNYYKNGEYAKRMKPLSDFVSVLTLPHCSWIQPFFGVETSGKFGDAAKEKLHNYFISTLSDLLNK